MSETVGYVSVSSFVNQMGSYQDEINSRLSEEEIDANSMPAERVQEILGHIINTGTENRQNALYINHYYENPLSAVSSWPSSTQSIAPEGVNFDDIVKQYPQAEQALEEMSNFALDDYDNNNGMVTAEQAYSMLQDAIGGKEPNTESPLYRLVNEGLTPADLARDYPFEGAEVTKTSIIDDVIVPNELLPEGDGWQHQGIEDGGGIILSVRPHDSGRGYEAEVVMLMSAANKKTYVELTENDVTAALSGLTSEAGAFWTPTNMTDEKIRHLKVGEHSEPSRGEDAQGYHISANNILFYPLSGVEGSLTQDKVFDALTKSFSPVIASGGADYLRAAAKEEREALGGAVSLSNVSEAEVSSIIAR